MGEIKNFGYCQCDEHTGKKHKQQLVAHHRAQQAQYPQFANDPDNIIYVCPSCHLEKIHDNGNFKKLSIYGESIRDQYLMKKGCNNSIAGKPQSSIESNPVSSGSSVDSGFTVSTIIIACILLIFVSALISSGRVWGWSVWTLLSAIIITLIIIGLIYAALYLLYKLAELLWNSGIKIYQHFTHK